MGTQELRHVDVDGRRIAYRVVALDLPGFGASDKPTDVRYNFDFFDSVFDGFLDAVGIEGKAAFAVHDLGGPRRSWRERLPEACAYVPGRFRLTTDNGGVCTPTRDPRRR